MGMYVSVASLSDATIAAIHADPDLVWQILEPDDPDAVTKARNARNKPGLFGRLFGGSRKESSPAPPPGLTLTEGEGFAVELDKAWHGMHYLFTGTADEGNPPLNFLMTGGRDVGDEEIWNGTPRTWSAAETRTISAALAALSDEELRRRFAPAEMMELDIYPQIWDRDPSDDDSLGWVMSYVGEFRNGLAAMVARGHGMLVVFR